MWPCWRPRASIPVEMRPPLLPWDWRRRRNGQLGVHRWWRAVFFLCLVLSNRSCELHVAFSMSATQLPCACTVLCCVLSLPLVLSLVLRLRLLLTLCLQRRLPPRGCRQPLPLLPPRQRLVLRAQPCKPPRVHRRGVLADHTQLFFCLPNACVAYSTRCSLWLH